MIKFAVSQLIQSFHETWSQRYFNFISIQPKSNDMDVSWKQIQ